MLGLDVGCYMEGWRLNVFLPWSIVSPVNQSVPLDDQEVRRLGEARRALDPCSIIIFGASGDLTSRKLIPAFYHLFLDKQMPSEFRIIGFARREKTDESWRQ